MCEPTKVCTKCGVEKAVSEFYVHKHRGVVTQCKVCMRHAGKEYRERDPQKIKESQDKHRAANAEKIRERNRVRAAIRYAEDPEKARAAGRAYYHRNKGVCLDRARVWREANREWIRQYHRGRLYDSTLKKIMGLKEAPPELIELKRQQVFMRRATRELNKALKEKENGSK